MVIENFWGTKSQIKILWGLKRKFDIIIESKNIFNPLLKLALYQLEIENMCLIQVVRESCGWAQPLSLLEKIWLEWEKIGLCV